MRYFLLDKVTEIKLGESIKGIKCVTFTDEVLHDHFPDHPILPGAMVLEGLAQLAGFLLEMTFNQGDAPVKRAILVQVDKMKYYTFSVPGDQLTYEAKIDSILGDAARVSVTSKCGDEVRATGKINFQMADIDNENVTKQRMSTYKIWTRGLENCPPYR